MGYYWRHGEHDDTKWNCETCTLDDKARRCCPLEEFKDCVPAKGRLGLQLANGMLLDHCPAAALDPWAVWWLSEYNWACKFGTDGPVSQECRQAFSLIMSETARCERLEFERFKREAERGSKPTGRRKK